MRTKLISQLLMVLFLAIACLPSKATDVETENLQPEDLVREYVAQTLEAMAMERQNDDPNFEQIESAPGETFSLEVTQQPATEILETQEDEKMTDGGEESIPESHYIWNILGHRQFFSIGCEASAADDWAKYFGVEVNEFKFQALMPLSDNPDLGFVGDVTGPWGQVPPYAYGVHAAPIAEVLRTHYGLPAQSAKEFTLAELKEEVSNVQPVIAWVIGNCTWSEPYEYVDKEGNKVVTAPYEHVVIVTGYDADSIRYMNNGKFYDIPTEYFERSWAVLGNMVVYYED